MGIAILVFITEIAISAPITYAPPSPRNIFALGKLNIRKFTNINAPKNKNSLIQNALGS